MAERSDPNLYSIKLAMQLDTSEVKDAIADFGVSIQDTEKQLTDAASAALTGFKDLATKTTAAFAEVASKSIEINKSTTEFKDTTTLRIKDLEKEHKLFKKLYELNTEFEEHGIKELKSQKKLNDLLKIGGNQAKGFDNTNKGIIKTVLQKNQAHDDQNQLVQEGVGHAGEFNRRINYTKVILDGITKAWHTIRNIIGKTLHAMVEVGKEAQNFVTENNRIYGSQNQILSATNKLTLETGILKETSIEAYKALINVKTPIGSIHKLAGEIAMSSRATGVNVVQIAAYTKGLRGAGLVADEQIRILNLMAAAQRKLGLNTEDMTRAMNNGLKSSAELVTFFGKDAPEQFAIAQAGIMGIGKAAAMEQKDVEGLIKLLQATGVKETMFWSMAGVDPEAGIEARYDALGKAAENVLDQLGVTAGQLDKISGQEIERALQQVGATNLTVTALRQLVKFKQDSMGTENEYLNSFSALTTELDKQKTLMGQVNNIFADRNDNWDEQTKILMSTLAALKSEFILFLQQGLLPVLKYVNMALIYFVSFIQTIKNFWAALEKIPILGKFAKYAKIIVTVLIVFGVVLAAAAVAVGTFAFSIAMAFGLFGRWVVRAAQTLANVMVTIAKAIGQSIYFILASFGKGLAALGKAIQPVMLPLLALGAAFLMVGVGALFFVLAVERLIKLALDAEVGITAVVWGVVGLIATIALLGLVLVGLGMLAQGPVALGVLVVAAAFLAVGLAALMAGAGMWLMSVAFVAIVNSMKELTTGQLILFAGELWIAAVMIVAAAPMLLLAAQALSIVGLALIVAAGIFWVAGLMMMGASTSFSYGIGIIESTTKGLAIASEYLKTIGKNIASAGNSMAEGSVALAIGSAKMTMALPGLASAGMGMLAAASSIGIGSWALKKAVGGLVGVSNIVADSGTKLLAGAENMLKATIALVGFKDAIVAINSIPMLNLDGFSDNMQSVSALLNSYAVTIETAANRINAAIMLKAIPALQAAKNIKVDQVVRSETLSTVQVMDKEEKSVQVDEHILLLREQNKLLASIYDGMQDMANGGNENLKNLASEFSKMIPDADQETTSLPTGLNAWA